MKKEYYFIDLETTTMKIVHWGTTPNATHSGNTDDPNIHRIFLPKGQYNKLMNHIDQPAIRQYARSAT